MNIYSGIIASLLIFGAQVSKESPVDFKPVNAERSCYVNAALYKEQLSSDSRFKSTGVPSRILYTDVKRVSGHAVCVFFYDGKWRVYDHSIGTRTVGAGKPDEFPKPSDVIKILDSDYFNADWMD